MMIGVPKDDKWHNVTLTYDGSGDLNKVKLYYDKKINGVDYHVCEQNGKIVSKTPVKDIIR